MYTNSSVPRRVDDDVVVSAPDCQSWTRQFAPHRHTSITLLTLLYIVGAHSSHKLSQIFLINYTSAQYWSNIYYLLIVL